MFNTTDPLLANQRRLSLSSIVKQILFPLYWLGNHTQRGLHKLAGEFVTKKILLSLSRNIEDREIERSGQWEVPKLEVSRFPLKTRDGAVLDTSEIYPKLTPHQLYIVQFCGTRFSYTEEIDALTGQAMQLQAHVIAFDYRGVNKSQKMPNCANDLIQDGIAQVQRLLDQHVQSQNIILKGISLGGAIATKVAKHFHDQGKPLYLFNDRSFSSIANVVEGWIRTWQRNGHTEPLYGKIIGKIAKPFIWILLSAGKWNINVVSDFLAIPQEYKEHLVVRTPHGERTARIKDDSTITHYASLYRALKPYCISPPQRKEQKEKRFVVAEESDVKEGHRVPLSSLRRGNITGQQAFENFAKKVNEGKIATDNNFSKAEIRC